LTESIEIHLVKSHRRGVYSIFINGRKSIVFKGKKP